MRRELYTQAFDEVLRQVTVNCAERGLLLLRCRDEINTTFQAYQTVYESSIGFGCRQALNAQRENDENAELICVLENDLIELSLDETELQAQIDAQKLKGNKDLDAIIAKFTNEVEFITVNNDEFVPINLFTNPHVFEFYISRSGPLLKSQRSPFQVVGDIVVGVSVSGC